MYGIPKMNEPLGLVQECKIHIMFSGIVERNTVMNVWRGWTLCAVHVDQSATSVCNPQPLKLMVGWSTYVVCPLLFLSLWLYSLLNLIKNRFRYISFFNFRQLQSTFGAFDVFSCFSLFALWIVPLYRRLVLLLFR